MEQIDRKPLEMISLQNLTATPSRPQRMLQGYGMQVKYRPGKELSWSDTLSRQPNDQQKTPINLDLKIHFVEFSPQKLQNIQEQVNKDPVLAELRDPVLNGSIRDELVIENGILLKGERIVLSNTLQPEILEKIHAGHQGVEKC